MTSCREARGSSLAAELDRVEWPLAKSISVKVNAVIPNMRATCLEPGEKIL